MTLPRDSSIQRLTPRQRECLRLTFHRKTSKEIAAELGLSEGTVSTYISEAVGILGARNRRHAAELLHDAETRVEAAPTVLPADPEKPQPENIGADLADPAPLSEMPGRSGERRRLLPLRQHGALGNDLGILQRVAWILGGGCAFAIAFGMLAVGARVVSDIVRALGQ